MAEDNPLVATAPQTSWGGMAHIKAPTSFTNAGTDLEGAGLFSDAASTLSDATTAKGWADGAAEMDLASDGMDAVGVAMDPLGSLAGAGIGWLIEHIGFLKKPLDYLAGDPEEITAKQQTWENIAKALNESLRKALENDPKVLIMGEDVGKLGGVFRITDGLHKDFGEDRVIDTPLAESGIVGTAIGLALRGYRPVVEIQFDGFVFPAYDQIVTQLAKMHARALGKIRLPIVIRIPYGGGIGAVEHHSESPEALFAHVAGLKVVSPSNASDAYWMLQQAIECNDPVIFFEPKRRYWDKGEVDTSAVPLSPHQAVVAQEGTDLTLAAYGPMVKVCLEAAAAASNEGRSLEVVDLRSLSPIDFDTLQASVEKTRRLVVVHEAPVFYGTGAEIAARITERCFYHLEAPVLRVGGFHAPYPPARLEEEYLPGLDRVLDAVDRALAF